MIFAKSNGHLSCDLCSTYWCKHIEKFVRSGDDEPLIWENYPDPFQLEIPIVPTSNLWATVLLEKPEKAPAKMYHVTYTNLEKKDQTEYSIGFIHPGECRSTMRSMLLDWFEGTQVTTGLQCTGRGHGYRQHKMLERDLKTTVARVTQLWSIWSTGLCLGCTFSTKGIDDLIPEVTPGNNPWR